MNHNPIPERVHSRFAAVYVRQSDPQQVRNNVGSRGWQQSLKQTALDLGWAEGRVLVFEELGASAVVTGQRPEFAELLRLIQERQIGMLFVVEPTRASRNQQDWAALLDACTLTDTWIHVDDRIIDPRNHASRLRLGITQAVAVSMSLHLFEKLRRGRLEKVRRGELRLNLPVGYDRVYERQGEQTVAVTRMTPNHDVRAALMQVFDLFDELGSATRVAAHYHQRNLTVPKRDVGKHAEVEWIVPQVDTILRILKNPAYAGAYVFFQRRTTYLFGSGQGVKASLVRVPDPENWDVLIKDAYPAYITWERFERNLERLKQNKFGGQVGWPRDGAALLGGLAHCGICGGKMHAMYNAKSGKAYYRCDWGKRVPGARQCQNIVAIPVERAVADLMLRALTPAQMQLTLEAQRRVKDQVKRDQDMRGRRLAQLQDGVAEAKRAWKKALDVAETRDVDPELLREIEKDWREKKDELTAFEKCMLRNTNHLGGAPFTAEQQEQLEHLPEDVATLWSQDDVDNASRKAVLRGLMARIEIRKDAQAEKVFIVVHWHSGLHSSVVLGDEDYRFKHVTPRVVVQTIRDLSGHMTSLEIAQHLSDLGHRTDKGHPFTASRVGDLKRRHGIRGIRSVRGRVAALPQDMYTMQEATALLGVADSTVRQWAQRGAFYYVKSPNTAVWQIHLPHERLAELRRFVAAMKTTTPSEDDVQSFERGRLTDVQWRAVQPLTVMPPRSPTVPARPRKSDRVVLDAMLWVFRNNVRWSCIPQHLPRFTSCCRRIQQWQTAGILDDLLTALSELLADEHLLVLRNRLRASPRVFEAFLPALPLLPSDPHVGASGSSGDGRTGG